MSLGQISKKYESGGAGPGTISSGRGDPGGKSYGEFQLALNTGTLKKYIKYSRYEKDFEGLELASKEFDDKWVELADRSHKFGEDQLLFIKKTHFDPCRRYATTMRLEKTLAINEALFSISVQHGGYKKIIDKACEININNELEIVKSLYQARRDYVNGLRLSSKLKATLNHRYDREEKDVIGLIDA